MDWLIGFISGTTPDGAAGLTLAAAVAVIIVALRRRRDVDVDEMKKRITDLAERVEALEAERAADQEEMTDLRESLLIRNREVFVLKSTLARHGLPDPTATLEAS